MDQIFDLLLLKKYIGGPGLRSQNITKKIKNIDFRFITIWPYEVI